jgi:hypothetical protein
MKLKIDKSGWGLARQVDSSKVANRLSAAVWMLLLCLAGFLYGLYRLAFARP